MTVWCRRGQMKGSLHDFNTCFTVIIHDTTMSEKGMNRETDVVSSGWGSTSRPQLLPSNPNVNRAEALLLSVYEYPLTQSKSSLLSSPLPSPPLPSPPLLQNKYQHDPYWHPTSSLNSAPTNSILPPRQARGILLIPPPFLVLDCESLITNYCTPLCRLTYGVQSNHLLAY